MCAESVFIFFVETLRQQREILVVETKARKKSKSRTTIFHNEQDHDLNVAPALKEQLRNLWTDIEVPANEFALVKELDLRGITYVLRPCCGLHLNLTLSFRPTIEEKKIEAPTVSLKKPRKKQVKKITNRHMDGIEDSMMQNQRREHLEKLQANTK